MTVKRQVAKKSLSQLDRATVLRARFNALFPELASIKDDLGELLRAAQNAPPHGEADGTLSEVQYNQLRSLADALSRVLVTSLFNSKK